ncbi:MAG: xanthine dehydrogenase iron-sulfur cluster and FAD-binding subunit A [Verrucomicrobiales bacterium]|jgi:xanthine dehydrogenase iron-sulfur cluster and FAD-binding subunit A
MQGWFEFTINGETRRVESSACSSSLFEYLRNRGFDSVLAPRGVENPGSDAVLVLDTNGAGRPAYRLILSTLLSLPQAAGRSFITLEGLLDADPPHPIVELARRHVPRLPHEARGAIHLALLEAWYRYDLLSPAQVAESYAGFCFRAGGFRRLRDAAEELVARVNEIRAEANPDFAGGTPEALVELRRRGSHGGADPFQDAFSKPLAEDAAIPEPVHYVDPDGARFYRPETISEVQKLRIEYPEAVLAHSGLTLMRSPIDDLPPRAVISTSGIAELAVILEHEDHFEIGAETPLTLLAETFHGVMNPLVEAIKLIECRAVRNQMTLAEHLLDPGRSPVLALPLYLGQAEFRTLSSDGEHHVSIPGFFKTRATRDSRPQQLLRSVLLPKKAGVSRPGHFCRTYVFGVGAANPQILASAGFAVEVDESGTIESARAAFTGLDSKVALKRSSQIEEALKGRSWNVETIDRAKAALAQEDAESFGDAVGSAESRQQLPTAALHRFFADHRPVDTAEQKSPEEQVEKKPVNDILQPVISDESEKKPDAFEPSSKEEETTTEPVPERLPLYTPSSVANIGPKPKPRKSRAKTEPDDADADDQLPLSFE